MSLRIPNKLLKELKAEMGLPFLVSITQHMVGEMRGPLSILVDADNLTPETLKMLVERGAKMVRE